MGAVVAVTREESSAAELRQGAAGCGDSRVACRMLAIAHVLDGRSRTEAAQLCGMDRQTLRDWVHRYNADGVEGLSNRTSPGRPAALDPEQMARLKVLVLAGPDRAKHGVVRWRCSDLQDVIEAEFKVELHERTVGKLLRKLRLTRLQPRPCNPKRDLDAQEAFKKTVTAQLLLPGSSHPQLGDQAGWVGGERLQDTPALLSCCRENRADDRELRRSGHGAKAAGDFLPQFHHPGIAFGLSVGERHGGIGQEAKHVLFAPMQTQQKVMSDSTRLASATLPFVRGASQGGQRLVERESFGVVQSQVTR